MTNPEFDQFARQYDQTLGESLPVGLNEDGYFAEYKIALMAARCKERPMTRVLDYGCGSGRSLPYLDRYFPDAEIWGYDVSPVSLEMAAGQLPRAKLFSDWNAACDTRFDAVIAANVFHHIPVEQRLRSLGQCRQILAGNGQLFLFEHNPYNPATRWVFERCPFDEHAEMLSMRTALDLIGKSGYSAEQHGYTLFFPRPLAFLRGLEPWLAKIPLGAQYFVQATK